MTDPADAEVARFVSPQRYRLKTKREFNTVYHGGRRVTGKILTIWVLPRDGRTRVGFVAGKRVGNAVVRNRAKRLMREAFRANQARLSRTYHLVVVARSGCSEADHRQVEAELLRHLARAGCLDSHTRQPTG